MTPPSRSTADNLSVNLDVVHDYLDHAVALNRALNGGGVGPEVRDRSAALARINKELLYLAHLCDAARVAAMDEYQRLRGFTEHL
jgi:hypothetical protein